MAGASRGSNTAGKSSIDSQSMRNSLNVRQSRRALHHARRYHDRSLNKSFAGSTSRTVRRSVPSRYENRKTWRCTMASRATSKARRHVGGAPQKEKSTSIQSLGSRRKSPASRLARPPSAATGTSMLEMRESAASTSSFSASLTNDDSIAYPGNKRTPPPFPCTV